MIEAFSLRAAGSPPVGKGGGRAALSERKSGLEIGFDAAKTTQDAIGPALRRPTSCGFADGLIGMACNPRKSIFWSAARATRSV